MKLLSIALIFLSLNVFARTLTEQQKLEDLNTLSSRIKAEYGPLEYKKNELKIDIDVLQTKYTELVKQTKNNSEFYYLMIKFVAEFKDSHFGARIPTDHKGKLGFNTDYVDNKVLIDTIDREVLSEEDFPFEKGDEILTFNGKPVMEEINTIYPYMGQGTKLTAIRKATSLLTYRPGTKVPVQEGKVKLTIKKGSSEFIEEAEVEWKLEGTPLDEFIAQTKVLQRKALMNFDEIALKDDFGIERSFRCSGDTRTKIPEDATIIMKKPFVAYYHPTEKGNIGYLRIPHYSPREKDKEIDAYELRFKQYEFAVNELEKNTVGLIIDQDHNCGGRVSYLHNMVSLFAKKPFAPTQFELLATKANYLNYKKWLDDNYKYTVDYVLYEGVMNLVKKTWLETNDFLTKKTSLSGKTEIEPNKIRYTKPIIILIDELSGSGGDAFPAMMQGIGRAKLLGTQTMGAGGHVSSLPDLAHSRLQVRITKSLFYHPNNVAIENNGAYPDIKYRPTRDDFIYKYRGYQKFYLNELFKLIK